ncbi:hypothetical protein TNCV_3849881 [Trichonephila clavipes]|nr:hypothetical protein TNCV_3849881 [Trichonephila clavipes]
MDAYSTLVDQILKSPVLVNKVQDIVRDSDNSSLNLVALNWKLLLANYARCQQFQKEAKHMFSPECTILKTANLGSATKLPLSITIKDSSLMNRLMEAMTSDVDLNKARLSHTVKVINGLGESGTIAPEIVILNER